MIVHYIFSYTKLKWKCQNQCSDITRFYWNLVFGKRLNWYPKSLIKVKIKLNSKEQLTGFCVTCTINLLTIISAINNSFPMWFHRCETTGVEDLRNMYNIVPGRKTYPQPFQALLLSAFPLTSKPQWLQLIWPAILPQILVLRWWYKGPKILMKLQNQFFLQLKINYQQLPHFH